MYFAYGWPKVAFTDLQPGDTYIYLKSTEKFLFAVSRTRVQLWTGGLYRIKLSECVRTEEDVKQEGVHMAALWSPVKATLAILTSENYLHLYAIHTWKDNLVHPSCNIALKDIQKVDIYLKSSIRLDSEFRALSLAGDGRLLLIGFADGTIASLSWSGKMKEVAYPLDDVTDFDGALLGAGAEDASGQPFGAGGAAGKAGLVSGAVTPPPEPNSDAAVPAVRSSGGGSSSAFASAAATTFTRGSGVAAASVANGYGHSSYPGISQMSRSIAQMSYCEHSKQVVMVLADGACAVCGTSQGGLSPLPEMCFGRWLCGPQHKAVCAQVGARAQLIAVGRENGEVELYRLHRTAIGSPGGPAGVFPGGPLAGPGADVPPGPWEPPVRTLSLENWGHKVQQTGSVSQVEWSPDGRALAVAYAGQGVVVWSPSGCRLMCSLRQPSPSGLSTFPSTASRGIISHQASLAARGLNATAFAESTAGRSLTGFTSGAPSALPRGASSGALTAGPQVPLDGGVSAISWGPMGYQLAVAEVGGGFGAGTGGGGLLEVMFAHSLPGHHRVARGGLGSNLADEEVHVLMGHDRLLLIREAGEAAMGVVPWAGGDTAEPTVGQVGDLTVSHVPVPHSYVASNWPLQQSAVSASGSDIAVSGRHGLAVYNRTMERWRLFGDISQERQVSCRALGWLANGVLVACSGPDPFAPPPTSPPPPAGPLGVGAAAAPVLGPTGNELLLLPRYHLDLTSLLARHPLQQPPIAMDCLGSHILLASEPLEITLLEVTLQGELSPTGNPRAIITTLREISMFDVGRHLSDVALVPLLPLPLGGPPGGGGPGGGSSNNAAALAAAAAAASGAAISSAPKQCVLLRWGGLLSVLDLEKGSEMTLATEIETFWLSDAITCHTGTGAAMGALASGGFPAQPPALAGEEDGGDWDRGFSASAQGVIASASSRTAAGADGAQQVEAGGSAFAASATAAAAAASAASTASAAAPSAATLDVEMPWWLYGPAGMQLCFPSSLGTVPLSGSVGFREGHDIELEFDQEVYPVGISLADDAIVGITQRIVRGPMGLLAAGNIQGTSASQLPCFHPIPESQPVLPCLLRRLLQRGAFQEAVSLARRHARGPHFARSLEWLLFTALEIDTNTSSLVRPAPGTAAAGGSARRTGAAPEASDAGAQLPHSSSLKSQSLLSSAAELVRHFPNLFAEVVVSVARKTDAALWPPLFDAVGSPSLLLDGLVEAGELASAACFLLIIDRLEGAPAAQAQALRLMRSSLIRGQYPLCCELLRFVVPPSDQEAADGRSLMSDLTRGGQETGPSAAAGKSDPKSDAQPAGTSRAEPPAPKASTSAVDSQDSGEAQTVPQPQHQSQQQQQGGRTWLGWLLGYGSGTAEDGGEEQQHQLQQQEPSELKAPARQEEPALGSSPDPDGAPQPPQTSSAVQQTLALLGGDTGRGALPSSPDRAVVAPDSGGSAVAPSSPSIAQLLLVSGASGSAGATGSTASAKAACKLVAEHAWRLLESGHVAALGQLVQTSSFLPGGLAGLMNQYRDSAYASQGCASHSALELLSALAFAVSELPVWSSEEVEMCASGVEALCREVGAVAWAVAMAVLLVDASTVTAFRRQQPGVWAEFVQMLHADASFSYLWDIVEVLSEGTETAVPRPAGGIGGAGGMTVGAFRPAGPGQQQEVHEETAGTAAAVTVVTGLPAATGVTGMFAAGSPTASVGLVELRTISVVPLGGEVEEGPHHSATPLAAIPGPRAGEVSIARG